MLIAIMIIWLLITFPFSYSLSGLLFDITYKTKYYQWKGVVHYSIISTLQLILLIICCYVDEQRKIIYFPLAMFCLNFSLLLSEPISVLKNRVKDKLEKAEASKLRIALNDMGFTSASCLCIAGFLICMVYFVSHHIYGKVDSLAGFLKLLTKM